VGDVIPLVAVDQAKLDLLDECEELYGKLDFAWYRIVECERVIANQERLFQERACFGCGVPAGRDGVAYVCCHKCMANKKRALIERKIVATLTPEEEAEALAAAGGAWEEIKHPALLSREGALADFERTHPSAVKGRHRSNVGWTQPRTPAPQNVEVAEKPVGLVARLKAAFAEKPDPRCLAVHSTCGCRCEIYAGHQSSGIPKHCLPRHGDLRRHPAGMPGVNCDVENEWA
jgi:hypothetical protein